MSYIYKIILSIVHKYQPLYNWLTCYIYILPFAKK